MINTHLCARRRRWRDFENNMASHRHGDWRISSGKGLKKDVSFIEINVYVLFHVKITKKLERMMRRQVKCRGNFTSTT